MLKFTLFGFPVEVRWPFWVVTALLGGAASLTGIAGTRILLIWVAVVFVSILLHELGHALAMRHFGDTRVQVVLHGMGGYAQGTQWRGRTEQLIISAAGPFASLLIGVLGMLVFEALPMRPGLLMIGFVFWKHVNIVWGLVNLLPIFPLDGGKISLAMHGEGGELKALRLSFYCAAGVAALFLLVWHSVWNAMFFGMLAWNNWQLMHHRDQIRWLS